MNGFSIWFSTGVAHILDPAAYDHILFVSLLAISYPVSQWKKLLILVTAFTVGHSLTLALSVLKGLSIPVLYIEFAIALSILLAGLFNLFDSYERSRFKPTLVYTVTLIFGLLHGLGFSFLLRSMLGGETGIVLPLLYFNLGIEAGQLIIVAAICLISLFLTTIIKIPFKHLKFTVVCLISLVALKICADRFLLFFA